jgi:hypothetical protein
MPPSLRGSRRQSCLASFRLLEDTLFKINSAFTFDLFQRVTACLIVSLELRDFLFCPRNLQFFANELRLADLDSLQASQAFYESHFWNCIGGLL